MKKKNPVVIAGYFSKNPTGAFPEESAEDEAAERQGLRISRLGER